MSTLIGSARCPLCGSEKAKLSVSKTNLACLSCNTCACQIFARGDRSDELLRAYGAAAVKPEAPAASPAPASGAAEASPSPKPARKGGFLDGILS